MMTYHLNTTNGNFIVTTVPGQNDVNSDMLIMSLPAGVNKIFIDLQLPRNPSRRHDQLHGVRALSRKRPPSLSSGLEE